MTPTIMVAVVGLILTGFMMLSGIGALLFKMGRWRSKAEGRSFVLEAKIDALHDRLDSLGNSAAEAHARLDSHLQGHVDG
jgi:hypothetical protein